MQIKEINDNRYFIKNAAAPRRKKTITRTLTRR